ncbi:NAD(P)/FAD-dependent oxidoreductase [Chondromyces crocatus]|uniref:FAD-dependent oxidoreductase n=1 Tax=Chondromyces crocatus TaxID=52 RepID=A0A0K1EIQ5_CHOCO|nr:FAD-dependent oxidoreductase [Chondromyces crocatus]AKT40746.1 FAD-dependent oxidoreductase [Chondromyces crocatus]
MTERARIAVIGAGIAGLACAAELSALGVAVTVFDKGRGVGGRVATRREGAMRFNHGAQYVTARDPGFGALLAGLAEAGVMAPWDAAGEGRWTGVPGMSVLGRHLAQQSGAEVRLQEQVLFLQDDEAGWLVRVVPAAEAYPGEVLDTGGVVERFDAVMLAIPPAQAAPLLLAAGHPFAEPVGAVTLLPCWTLMVAFAKSVDAPDVQRFEAGPLAWIARENSRPGADTPPDRWVVHASPAWSQRMVERDPAEVQSMLLGAFVAATGVSEAPLHVATHRWMHARTEQPLGEAALWDPARRIGVCGDYCLGARVEAAWLSGRALAAQVAAEAGG